MVFCGWRRFAECPVLKSVDTLWREESYIENFAENQTDLDHSVNFALNSIGIVHGKVHDGVCFEVVDGKVHGRVGPPVVRGDKRRRDEVVLGKVLDVVLRSGSRQSSRE